MPGPTFNLKPLYRLVLVLAVLFTSSPAWGQQSGVLMDIQRDFLGLGGVVQRGVWTPVRVDLTNIGAENVEVTCRWLLRDEDGDELVAERPKITLVPQRQVGVWLYANPPMSTRPDETWVFQVVETSSGELIEQAQVQLSTSAVVESSVNLVGLCGFKDLGLSPWTRWSTQHEQLRLVRGLNLQTLPDRWYGLDGLTSLVWFPVEGGEPTDSRVSDRTKRALREWVYRGGHLVIVLPFGGQQWTSADSGLADLIDPLKPGAIKQAQARPPMDVFDLLRRTDPVPVQWFDLSNAPGYTSLAEVDLSTGIKPQFDAQGNPIPIPPNPRPMIVGHRVGFGQVTLVGIDLSETEVLKSIDPFRLHRVWTRIFSWRGSMIGELLPPSEFEGQSASQYVEAKNANHVELGTWIGPRVSRQRKTGPAVGLAFVLFIVYALAAALTFPNLLRSRNWERHSWMLFVGIVALFSVVAWGGAWMMRPASSSAAHFTVLDIDGNSNIVRARSWQSLLIPSFTTAEIAVSSEADGLSRMDVVNLIASPGHTLTIDAPGYPDQRTYAFDASQPSTVDVPMRSTTKSLIVDFLGQITAQRDGMPRPWTMPKASLRIANNGLPAGTITHRFADKLHDVRIIFCPGGEQKPAKVGTSHPPGRPLVYEYKNANGYSVWEPNKPLALPAAIKSYKPLWIRPKLGSSSRPWNQEGFLGEQVALRLFQPSSDASPNIVKEIDLLSFYDTLPPPIYQSQGFGNPLSSKNNTYSRSLMRDLDLTHLITGRRIILIGHLKKSACPVPMTVDGDDVDSEGWTVVRWVYDL